METITEDYVSFEAAKLLKEKGFSELTAKAYPYFEDKNYKYDISCPTLQMAMKWLREVHYLFIELKMSKNTFLWGYRVSTSNGRIVCFHANNFNKYEEACEAAIKYCLEKLI